MIQTSTLIRKIKQLEVKDENGKVVNFKPSNPAKEEMKNLTIAIITDIKEAIKNAVNSTVYVPVPMDGGLVAVTQFKATLFAAIEAQIGIVLGNIKNI